MIKVIVTDETGETKEFTGEGIMFVLCEHNSKTSIEGKCGVYGMFSNNDLMAMISKLQVAIIAANKEMDNDIH